MQYKHVSFLQMLERVNPLFLISGFLCYAVSADWMHCKHMGLDQYFGASTLWLLCYQMLPGTYEQNLNVIFGELMVVWRQHGISMSNVYRKISLSMIVKQKKPRTSFPKMRGRAIEVKNLMKGLVVVFKQHMTPDSVPHKTVLAGLKASVEMDLLVDMHADEIMIPEAAAKRIVSQAFLYGTAQNAVATHYNCLGHFLFDVTYKTHATVHCALQALWLNPQLTWCYSNEDFMRTVRYMVKLQCHGKASTEVGNFACENWLHVQHKRFTLMEME
jgi:hypothetical protein